ncbi:hypothetical protein L0F63_006818, partial [Massospora cicadina]
SDSTFIVISAIFGSLTGLAIVLFIVCYARRRCRNKQPFVGFELLCPSKKLQPPNAVHPPLRSHNHEAMFLQSLNEP